MHKVVHGDTLSTLATQFMKGDGPLYGPQGRVARIWAANPHVTNPDFIAIGQEVYIPNRGETLQLRQVSSEPSAIVAEQTSTQTISQTQKIETKQAVTESQVVAPPTAPAPAAPSPVTVLNPPQAENVAPQVEEEKQWGFGLGAALSYLRIEGVDTMLYGKASLVSDTGVTVTLNTQQSWSEDFYTFQELNLSSYRFINVKTGQNITNPDMVSELRFGGEKSLTENWGLIGIFGVRQTLFVKTENAIDYVFERIPTSFIQLGSRHRLLQKKALSLYITPYAEYFSSAGSSTIEVEPGFGGGVQLSTEYKKQNRTIKTSVGFERFKQESNIVEQTQSELIFGLSYQSWVF